MLICAESVSEVCEISAWQELLPDEPRTVQDLLPDWRDDDDDDWREAQVTAWEIIGARGDH